MFQVFKPIKLRLPAVSPQLLQIIRGASLLGLLGILLTGMTPIGILAGESMSWPRADGPQYNRISRENRVSALLFTALPQVVDPAEESPYRLEENFVTQELWAIREIQGQHTPLIFNGKLYTLNAELLERQKTAETQPESEAGGEAKASLASRQRQFIDCWYIRERDPEPRFRYEILSETATGVVSAEPLLVGDPEWRQLFCLTAQGTLIVLDSDLGSLLRKSSLSELAGKSSPPDLTATPLVFENLILLTAVWNTKTTADGSQPGKQVLLALDRRNGQVCWWQERELSEPVASLPELIPAVAAGQVVVVNQWETGKIALQQIRTGKPVCQLELTDSHARAQELLYDAEQLSVLSTTPVNKTSENASEAAQRQWTADVFVFPVQSAEKTSPVKILTVKTPTEETGLPQAHWKLGLHEQVTSLLVDNRFYAATSGGELLAYEVTEQGEKSTLPLASPGPHQMLWIEQQVLVTSSQGDWEVFTHLPATAQPTVEANANVQTTEIATQTTQEEPSAEILPEGPLRLAHQAQWPEPIQTLPAIAKQQIFVRSQSRITAIGPFDNNSAVSDLQIPLTHLAEDSSSETPGFLQLLPARQTLQPGFQLSVRALLYNDLGAYLDTLPVESLQWTWSGPGQLKAETGTLELPVSDAAPGTYTLKASWKNLSQEVQITIPPSETESREK